MAISAISNGESSSSARSKINSAFTQLNGLGDASTKNVGTTTGTVCAGDDSRLSNARTPTTHTHTTTDLPIASQEEAEAGTATDKVMTPQRVAQAIAALGGGGSSISSPKVIHVSTEGSDVTGDGTAGAPFASVYAGVTAGNVFGSFVLQLSAGTWDMGSYSPSGNKLIRGVGANLTFISWSSPSTSIDAELYDLRVTSINVSGIDSGNGGDVRLYGHWDLAGEINVSGGGGGEFSPPGSPGQIAIKGATVHPGTLFSGYSGYSGCVAKFCDFSLLPANSIDNTFAAANCVLGSAVPYYDHGGNSTGI